MTSKTDIKNRIKQSSLCCVYCGKSYKTKCRLDKHLVLCETIYRSKNNKNTKKIYVIDDDDDIEEMKLPSQRQMYNIILELTMKCNKLEEKIEQMNKWVERKKKKINVLDLLNSTIKPHFVFNNIAKQIIIDDEILNCLFSNGFVSAFSEIMLKNIFEKKNEQQQQLPFSSIENKIFVYKNNSWCELEKEGLLQFMNMINIKLVKGLTDWREKLEVQNAFSDNKIEQFNKTLSKLLNNNFKQETLFNKIKGIICEQIKIDIKSLIECEFA